jgi:DNA invertase Pin-like site-specific DNA recombinase
LRALDEFSHLGVDFISLSESIDTSTPVGKMIFTVLGAVAELERNLIKERVQMGISRARKQGKALGRPRVEVDPRQVAGLRTRGLSWNQIAVELGIGRGTAERAFRSLSQKPLHQPTTAELIS